MTADTPRCPGCGHSQPRDWCWDARDIDCPLGKPPRWVTSDGGGSTATYRLWQLLRTLRDQMTDKEKRHQ